MEDILSIINKTKTKSRLLPFSLLSKIKDNILTKKYSLSIAYINESEMQKINKIHRNKNKPTNVLSFSLTKNSGELLLCLDTIKKETEKFERNFTELLGFLVIHGMLHLKGYKHSSRMEVLECKYDQKYFRGNRHRVRYDASRSRRIFKGRKNS
ncbi:MAG: rRNA maturation RNase YbeY [Patescibacteria group bacterium]